MPSPYPSPPSLFWWIAKGHESFAVPFIKKWSLLSQFWNGGWSPDLFSPKECKGNNIKWVWHLDLISLSAFSLVLLECSYHVISSNHPDRRWHARWREKSIPVIPAIPTEVPEIRASPSTPCGTEKTSPGWAQLKLLPHKIWGKWYLKTHFISSIPLIWLSALAI